MGQLTRRATFLVMGDVVAGSPVRTGRFRASWFVGVAQPGRFGADGRDDVEIRLASGPGTPPRAVTRAASGGELSRVMLAIEVATATDTTSVPTFVFDEVDAGVGGRAALDVGARLAALARHAQVVVVTHLPQVAAYADRHLVVHKASDGHITSSGVHAVEGEDRLRELARMMAGVDSGTALEHARELVEQATARRGGARSGRAGGRKAAARS